MRTLKIKYNLRLTLLSRLSENKDIIPELIQKDLKSNFPAYTITNRRDLEKIMAQYLFENDIVSYDIYEDFISDSYGQIFIFIDN